MLGPLLISRLYRLPQGVLGPLLISRLYRLQEGAWSGSDKSDKEYYLVL